MGREAMQVYLHQHQVVTLRSAVTVATRNVKHLPQIATRLARVTSAAVSLESQIGTAERMPLLLPSDELAELVSLLEALAVALRTVPVRLGFAPYHARRSARAYSDLAIILGYSLRAQQPNAAQA